MIRNWNIFIFGSENPKDKGKCHLCDDDGKVFCGANIKWGEATAEIIDFQEDQLLVSAFGGNYRLPVEISIAWKLNRCKNCERELNRLKPYIN